MEQDQQYRELCMKMGLPASASLLALWKILCTPDEAAIAALLPGAAADLAGLSGREEREVQSLLDSLYDKGAAFKNTRDGVTSYKLAKNIVQFHDACLLWKGATGEFYDLWKKVMDQDFATVMRNLPPAVKLPSFMRVVPVDETVQTGSTVLPYEACTRLIDHAQRLAVVPCPCRVSQRNCDAPLETCIQLDRGAEYAVDRGHGRAIGRDEALAILRASEEAGLVHMVENRGFGNAICNCCSCCCEMFRLVANSGKKWILAPSRYLAVIDERTCSGCGACEAPCPVKAVEVAGTARVDAELCLGCGLCASRCPEKAISLAETRPESHIPAK